MTGTIRVGLEEFRVTKTREHWYDAHAVASGALLGSFCVQLGQHPEVLGQSGTDLPLLIRVAAAASSGGLLDPVDCLTD